MNCSKTTICFLVATLIFYGYGCDSRENRHKVDSNNIESLQEELHSLTVPEAQVFYWGFDLRSSPQEDARQYIPFLDYLNEATGLSFELRFTPATGNIVDDLGTGKLDFAALGAGSYILAHEKYGVLPLVRGVNLHGTAEYQSVIVVPTKSSIKKIGDLRGKSIAFGSATSTQGYLIPRICLEKNGIKLNDFSSHTFTNSHLRCANEVLAGRVDACGMQDTMGKEFVEKGLLKIIHTSNFFPSSGIVCSKNIDPGLREKVQRALLDFQPNGRDAPKLYNWQKTEMPNGFIQASDSDYDELRHWAKHFGYY